ncbi:CatB-related O-acetyltransferase [Deltaproteobacteria bacterium IMCC39524]|nr:CatB-related O-acetyltransferase [Deltaproteobacteria bacterium IMCC39524]
MFCKIYKKLKRYLISEKDIQTKDGTYLNEYESQESLNINIIGSKKPTLNIGKGSYVNGIDLYCWDDRIEVSIGRYCSIADKVTIIAGGEHDMDWVTTYPFIPKWKVEDLYHLQKPRFKGDIKIGNDVWISNNVVILSGVTISDGAVVGAGSIVTKDVNPYSIVAGNPARVVKKRFSDDIIEQLLDIKWWDWDEEKIHENLILLSRVNDFIQQHKC